MIAKLEELKSKNAIVGDENCHDYIVEIIHNRSHLEHRKYYYATDNSLDGDKSSDDKF